MENVWSVVDFFEWVLFKDFQYLLDLLLKLYSNGTIDGQRFTSADVTLIILSIIGRLSPMLQMR